MKVLLRRMLQAHKSLVLSTVASWEGPEKLELSELILNPDLGFRCTVAYVLADIVQRGKPEEKSKPLFGDTPAVALAVARNRKHQGTSERADDFCRARALQDGWF
jgi:hypothetical protein